MSLKSDIVHKAEIHASGSFSLESKTPRYVKHFSEPYFQQLCDVCTRSGKHVDATDTCTDCWQSLCRRCNMTVESTGSGCSHVNERLLPTLDESTAPRWMCRVHKSERINMYCREHDNVCCETCIEVDHRNCRGVDTISTVSAGIHSSSGLQTARKDVKRSLEELRQRKTERERDKERLCREKSTADRTVQETAGRLIELINNLKQNTLVHIQRTFREFQQQINHDLNDINKLIASLERDLSTLVSNTIDNEAELFVNMKECKRHVEQSSMLNHNTGTDLKREALHFIINEDVEECLKTNDRLGELETPYFSTSEAKRYKIKLRNDKNTCDVSGICLLSNGNILILDQANQKLKRLDSSYSSKGHCTLSGVPESICLVGQTRVAVGLGQLKMIELVSVREILSPLMLLRIDVRFRAVAYSRQEYFVTCGGDSDDLEGPGEIRVYNAEGEFLRNVPENLDSRHVFHCPLRIALSADGNRVIITDEDYGVVAMDRDGSNINVSPLDAFDLCVQSQNLWFVSGDVSNNIYQIDTQGTVLGPLLTVMSGIDDVPSELCYCHDNSQLIIGLENRDYIEGQLAQQQHQQQQHHPSQEPLYAKVNKKRQDEMGGNHSPTMMLGSPDGGDQGADSWV